MELPFTDIKVNLYNYVIINKKNELRKLKILARNDNSNSHSFLNDFADPLH